jgi:hypothetical protein
MIGSQWPTNFDNLDTESDILDTDTLRVVALSDDPLLQNKLKENVELAEAATRALEHIYEEEPPPAPLVEQLPSPKTNSETIFTIATSSDSTSVPVVNGTGPTSSSSPTTSNDHPSASSSPTTAVSTSNNEVSLDSTVPPPPPPPPPSSSSTSASPNTIAPATAVATTLPLAHSAAAIQAAYRQTSLLGALPTAAAIRAASGALYATTGGLANGLTGQVIYGGKINFY